jgi:hypothetical protein
MFFSVEGIHEGGEGLPGLPLRCLLSGKKRSVFGIRVARWFVFEPKIPIWINFGGPCDGRCWYILWPFGLFYGHLSILYGLLVYFMAIWSILWSSVNIIRPFGIFYGNFPVLVSFSKKNLATLFGIGGRCSSDMWGMA